MATANFDELLGRIRGLLIAMGTDLSADESAEVEELLDQAELGEALRTLAWLIVEEGKRIPMADIREMETLAVRMGISDELPEVLTQHGICDG
jgi:hypothetical protein